MKIGITGICGSVGSELTLQLRRRFSDAHIVGIDNFSRPGSETSRPRLKTAGVAVKHGDVRCPSDLDVIGDADWLIDAAANPSMLAGVDGRASSRQAVEHNLVGTLNVLEFCKERGAGLVLLSTSRVYSVKALNRLPLVVRHQAFVPDQAAAWPNGASAADVTEKFSTAGPVSLYGATKVGGAGHQVRDALHSADLADLVERQLRAVSGASGIWNVGGGPSNAMSLAQLSAWCTDRLGERQVSADPGQRRWDVPWVVMDATRARARFGWTPTISVVNILDEIAQHHRLHPDWLSLSHPL